MREAKFWVSATSMWCLAACYVSLLAYKVRLASKGEGTPGTSGQNDPAQMFQQILQQLTQGQ
jgi:hypothetical protein